MHVRERSPYRRGCHTGQAKTRTTVELRRDSQLL